MNNMLRAALMVLVGAGALVGCGTDSTTDEGLEPGTYAVQSIDLASCATDSWLKSTTAASSLVVEASGDGYVVQTCTDGGTSCSPTSPSRYALTVGGWNGQDGGAYLVENGCYLVHVDATATLVNGELTIEATRWVGQLSGGSCTYDEVLKMMEGPCDSRTRLVATVQ